LEGSGTVSIPHEKSKNSKEEGSQKTNPAPSEKFLSFLPTFRQSYYNLGKKKRGRGRGKKLKRGLRGLQGPLLNLGHKKRFLQPKESANKKRGLFLRENPEEEELEKGGGLIFLTSWA